MSLKIVHINKGDELYERLWRNLTKKAQDRANRRKEIGNKVIGKKHSLTINNKL